MCAIIPWRMREELSSSRGSLGRYYYNLFQNLIFFKIAITEQSEEYCGFRRNADLPCITGADKVSG